MEVSTQQVWDALRSCYDPEVPVDIVELGLIYDVQLERRADAGYRARIEMTFTAPGCEASEWLLRDVEEAVGKVPGVEQVDVEVVLDPPWTPDRLSEAARLELGLM